MDHNLKTLLIRNLSKLPISIIVRVISSLKKLIRTLTSKKFYQVVSDEILEKPSVLDSNLYFICYFTLLLSNVLNNREKIRQFIWRLKSKVSDLVIDGEKSNGNSSDTADIEAVDTPSNLSLNLKKISSYLSDIRIFNRLFACVPLVPWVVDEIEKPYNSRTTKLISYIQLFNVFGMQLLENIGFVTDHNFVTTSDNNWWCIKTYCGSSVLWGLYILIEMGKLQANKHNVDKRSYKVGMFKHLTNLPLAYHWAVETGILSSFWVGLLGTSNAYFGFVDCWKNLDY